MKINYLKHNDIDKEKWDRCIASSINDLIYARSFYLDIMSPGWDALEMNGYESVMPLTWKKKFGIRYLHQPSFTQQLGIFGPGKFDEILIKPFLDKAFKVFDFAEINLNFANTYKAADKQKSNFFLPLNKPFEEIEKNFHKEIKREVRKNRLLYLPSEKYNNVILLFKSLYNKKTSFKRQQYERFSMLCDFLSKQDSLIVRKVEDEKGQLLSSAILFSDKKRLYYILAATTDEGRKVKANYFLLYNLIKEYSEQDRIFDFEGSDIPSIQFFFKKFGPLEEKYPFIVHNNLPLFAKKLKAIGQEIKAKSN